MRFDTESSSAHAAPLMLELSDKEGKRWRRLPLNAPGLPFMRSEDSQSFTCSLKRASLLAVVNEQPGLERALFLGLQGIQGVTSEWWWLPDVDAPQVVWKKLGSAVAPLQFPSGEIESGMTTPEGRRIYFRGSRDGGRGLRRARVSCS